MLSRTSDVEILHRLEIRGFFAGEKGTEVRREVVAYLEKLRLSKVMQNEPTPKPAKFPEVTVVEAVVEPLDGSGSELTPGDVNTAWLNETPTAPAGLVRLGTEPPSLADQFILANVGSPSVGFPPAEIYEAEVSIRNFFTSAQNVVVDITFWDRINLAAPANTHCLEGNLGRYQVDFGLITGGTTSIYPAVISLVPPVISLDNEVWVELKYRNSIDGPIAPDVTTIFIGGVNSPQIGNSAAGWFMDNDGDGFIETTEGFFDFAAPNNTADFRAHLRARAPTTESEPNDSVATADNTACALTLAGSIDPAGDVDYFRFSLSDSRLVTADVDCMGGDSTLDLRTSGGAPIESDDDDGPGACSSITRVLAAGTYILEVRDKGNDGVMPYNISLACAPLVETEPNDTAGTADTTACNVTIPGAIDALGDVDYWTFSLSSTNAVRIHVDAGADDSTMSLYDSGLNLVEFDDDDGPGFTSWIGRILPADTYFIEVRAINDETAFSYDLVLTCCAPEDVEPNDTAANATPISCGQSVCGGISPAGDADYWTFSVVEQTQVTINVDCSFGDSIIELRDSNDELVEEDDDDGPDLCSLIDRLVPVGTYFIVVREFGNNAQLPYDLDLACVTVPAVDEMEPNDNAGTANPISCGTPLRGIISSGADLDFWVNTEIVALSLVSVRVDTPTSSLDPTVTILDSSLNVVAFNDDANGLDSEIQYLLFPDTYYFVVDGLSGTGPTATYTLSVDCSPPNADASGCIDNGHTVAGSLDAPSESDTYAYAATAGEIVRMIAKGGANDLNLVVVDSSGNLVDRDDDDAEGVDPQVCFVPASDDSYTVYVSEFLGQTGGYTLSSDILLAETGVESEPNGSRPDALTIGHNSHIRGSLSVAADQDFYRFFSGAGEIVSVTVLSCRGSDNTPGRATDPLLEIRTSNDTTVASSDDDEEDFDSVITNFVLPPTTGFTYYVVVRGFSAGEYDLFFQFTNVPYTLSPNVGPKVTVGSEIRAALTATNPSVERRLNFKIERIIGGVTTLLSERLNVRAPNGLNKIKPNVLFERVPMGLTPGTSITYRTTENVNGRNVRYDFDVIVE